MHKNPLSMLIQPDGRVCHDNNSLRFISTHDVIYLQPVQKNKASTESVITLVPSVIFSYDFLAQFRKSAIPVHRYVITR